MPVSVKWFPTLVRLTRSGTATSEAAWRPGLTPGAILADEGFPERDREVVMAIVNGAQARHDAPLAEGDSLEFLVGIQGG